MFRKEATWIYQAIEQLDPEDTFPLLNLGSSTLHFRTLQQPFIDEVIFEPLRRSGRLVVHCDIKNSEGVDLKGDLTDPAFKEEVRRRGFRSVLCSNLLEHVDDPAEFSRHILDVVPSDGYIIVTGPYKYPEHLDPIDNGLRPTVAEFHALFPGTQIIIGQTFKAEYHFNRFRGKPKAALGYLISLVPRRNFQEWRRSVAFLKYEFVPFEQTCVVLRKR